MLASMEQPNYAPLMKDKNYMSKFDHTLTYELTSSVPIITIHPHWDADAYFDAAEVPFAEKLDAAVMFTSNCMNGGKEANQRFDYYKRLMDVYVALLLLLLLVLLLLGCATAALATTALPVEVLPPLLHYSRATPATNELTSPLSGTPCTRTASACTTRTSRRRPRGSPQTRASGRS